MLNKRTTSSAWMRGVANTLSAQGLDVVALFAQAGLRIENLEHGDFRWPTEGINRLWTIAAELSGNPDVGLFTPDTPRTDHYGLVGYAMMSSPDLETGLARLIRYNGVVSSASTISFEPAKGGKWTRVELFGNETPIPRQRYDYMALIMLTFCRWMLGRPIKPLSVAFMHKAPTSLAAYDEAFGAPLRFNAAFNGLLISREDLACKLATAAPELADVHDRIALEALRRLEKAEISRRAREAVVRHLPDGAPSRSTIAAALNMSDHTFQRRLTSEGTSFSKLVDETRRELVQHHLTDTRLSSSEIAYLVGYADQSTFFRATHRWFGESPGEYRARVTAGHEREMGGPLHK
ncbi:AraC family transcriptional regulator [Bradyrhizobium sp. UFLA05-109]